MSDWYERERSRDRRSHHRGRSSSSDSYERRKKDEHKKKHHSRPKRVKFSEVSDVKIFKKEDQPSCKGLSDNELQDYMKKLEKQRGMSVYEFNWENMRHRDAQLENNSIREQRERQRVLSDKLQGVKEQIQYYLPENIQNNYYDGVQAGQDSLEQQTLNKRLDNVLACFYVNLADIPAEPTFELLNNNTRASPQQIKFKKQTIDSTSQSASEQKHEKESKPLKGILKMHTVQSEPQPKTINPNLILVLKEINAKKGSLSREQVQTILKPYKESGQLAYLKENPHIYDMYVKNSNPEPSSRQFTQPNYQQPYYNPMKEGIRNPSPSPQSQQPPFGYNQYQQYNPNHNASQSTSQPHPTPTPNQTPSTGYMMQPGAMYSGGMPGYNPTNFVSRNYKTVHCKYYHSPQGCVKAQNCTFIHDEQFAGQPTPSMLRFNRGMSMGNQPPMYQPQAPMMPNPMSVPNQPNMPMNHPYYPDKK